MRYHNWIRHGSDSMIIEIIIRDGNRAKVEGFLIDIRDKKALRKILATIKTKYNIDLSQKIEKRNKDMAG